MPQIMMEDENSTTQLSTNAEKASAFAKHFMGAHNLTLQMGEDDFSQRVSTYIHETFEARTITNFRDRLNIDFSRQFGFRAGRTTCHALFKLASEIAYNLNDGVPTHMVALDFEKAYDTVWINGFIYKMHFIFGFSQNMCQLLLNLLQNRTYTVHTGGNHSEPYTAPAGIPQGFVLSCLLFIIYVVDFPTHDGALNIKTTQFADDTLLSVQSVLSNRVEEELNDFLTKIAGYLNLWKLKINVNKCDEVAVLGGIKQTNRNVRKNAKLIEIQMNGEIIPKTNNLKYLGIHFSSNFEFNFHTGKIRNKMLAAYFSLKNIFTNRKIDKPVKLLAYKQIIRPIALYGAPIWLQVSKQQINKIALVERKILRASTGLYRRPDSVKFYPNETVYGEAMINTIEREMINKTIKFLDKLALDLNTLIRMGYLLNHLFVPPFPLPLSLSQFTNHKIKNHMEVLKLFPLVNKKQHQTTTNQLKHKYNYI